MHLRLFPLVALFAASACAGSPAQRTTDAGPEVPEPPASALVETGAGPVGLAVDSHGRVWVTDVDAGSVTRINAAGDGVDLTRRVGEAPLRLAAADGSLWVTVFADGTLLRLDEDTGRMTDTVRVGAEPEGLTAAFGSLWVVLQSSAELLRVNPRDGTVVHGFRVGEGPRLVEAGGDFLWVSDFASGRVVRIDPVTGDVRRSAPVCDGPQGMAAVGSTLWVACTTEEVLVGVDMTTLKPTSRLSMPGAPDAVTTAEDGRLLVALQTGPTLAVVDPQGSSVVHQHTLGDVDQLYDQANVDVVLAEGVVWVSSYLEGGVYSLTL